MPKGGEPMANDIKGITVKIGADTTDLSKAMSSANPFYQHYAETAERGAESTKA